MIRTKHQTYDDGDEPMIGFSREKHGRNSQRIALIYFSMGMVNRVKIGYTFTITLTKSEEPFDCRIRLEKNGSGKWTVAIYLIRIGSNQKVVSNVAQGGSVSGLKPFLEANYGEKAEDIRDSIESLAKSLPNKIEKKFNTNLTSLGIDIGIDLDGKLYLFEIETGPGFEFALGEIALMKSEYYKYILNKLSERQQKIAAN